MLHFHPQNLTITLFFTIFITFSSISQVGIGTTDPKTQLDVEGAISLREGTSLNLNNGPNSNLDLGTTPYSSYRITGPTADFSIRSITPETGADGQMVTLINTTTQDLTIVHDSGSTSRRIYNPGGVDILITGQYSTVTLQYNASLNKWFLLSFQNGNLISDDWTTTGNSGTTAGANFLGTTDSNDLSFFTDNTEKLRITTGGHFRSFTDGTSTFPIFSWDTDRDTGFYRIGADVLGLTTGGSESVRMSSTETVINDDSDDYDFRVESNGQDDMLFVDGGQNAVGIATNTPQTALHVAGASNIVRIESLNNANNANNNGIDPSVVMVNTNGDLFLRPSVDDFPIDANDGGSGSEVFMAAPIVLDTSDGTLVAAIGYTTDITLTRTTLVEVAFWTAVQVEGFAGSFTMDNRPRLFGGLVQTGTGTDIVYDSKTYTNAATSGTITIGYFTIGGNGFITLPAGTHTIQLVIFTSGGESDGTNPAEGVRTTFGANSFNRFQIVYHN